MRELVWQQVGPPQLEQRGHDLAVGEVAGGAEQDEGGRVRDPLEAQALAERVLEALLAGRAATVLGREAEVAHRARRVLPGGAAGGAAGRRRGVGAAFGAALGAAFVVAI